MANEPSDECKALQSNCSEEDKKNNVTEPDFNGDCWKLWLKMCLDEETPSDSEDLTTITSSKIALIIFLVFVAVMSIGTNSMVCLVFSFYRDLRLIRHYFVINLAAADIFIAAILIPLFVTQLLTNNIDLCQCQLVLDIGCGTASILSLSLISLERYVAVVYSLQYHSIATHRKAVLCVVFIWIYSAIVSATAIPDLVASRSPVASSNSCFFMSREYLTFVTFASFLFPVGVMVTAYWKIFLVALAHARRIESLNVSDERVVNNHVKNRMKRELKGAKTLTIIMGTHIVCWCPHFVFLLVYTYCPPCWSNTMHVVNFIILFLRYLNSFANPVVYSGINRQFRVAIKRFVFGRNNAVEEFHTGLTRP